jgi:hypothetical protein
MDGLLRKLRAVPLAGWLALVLALVVVGWRRWTTLAQLHAARAQANADLLRARQRLDASLAADAQASRAEVDAAVSYHADKVVALDLAGAKLAAAQGKPLTDEINEYFKQGVQL